MADTASTPSAKPVKVFDKNEMRASVFENERTNSKSGEKFTVCTVQLSRTYKTDGTFHRTHSIRPQDLQDAINVLGSADAYLNQRSEK